ncbi:MAG: GGDEF domain-containing protein [gamma proteobacterium endosymbiont of Lamellibrachia anaximandri]|nr:GGDEF domain-containing protein [gamma proteobacterium endosymbiont of Lamellibrachia anaximandri]MBL3616554.1 GGDEF domain-containing protein [gamma proteobacterium endosymbiont of Lamellibrachia anaximandri]
MKEQKEESASPALFHPDTPDQSGEFFRLTIPLLAKHQLPINPVNFSLFYNYMAGRDARLKEKLDSFLEGQGDWSQEGADKLFRRFLYSCDEVVLDDLREELLAIVAQTIGVLVDIAGKAAISNDKLEQYINCLAESQKAEDVLAVVTNIMSDTRVLAMESKRLERQLTTSSNEMDKLKNELESAKQEAYVDVLTGVFNRRGFDQTLDHLIADAERRQAADFSLILVDLDQFKEINDTHGHLVGDKVLNAIGKLLKTHTKGSDSTARIGGDEFALLLPETSISSAFSLAENLRKNIKKLVLKRPSTGETLVDVSASLGVASFRLGESANNFLSRCDKSMYRAKKLGKGRVVLAD